MPGEYVEIVEVGLRDGLQIRPAVMPAKEKLARLYADRAAGARVFEVPLSVPPEYLSRMADAAEAARAALDRPGLTVRRRCPTCEAPRARSPPGRRC